MQLSELKQNLTELRQIIDTHAAYPSLHDDHIQNNLSLTFSQMGVFLHIDTHLSKLLGRR